MLTVERLREVLSYDENSGLFHWKKHPDRPRIKEGKIAGFLRKTDGYILIRIDYANYYAHRLAWFYVHGEWPPAEIDHRFGNRADNRISELRPATTSTNQQNLRKATARSKTGYLGVIPSNGKFCARIGLENKSHYLGTFQSAELAHKAYIEAKRRLHSTCTI